MNDLDRLMMHLYSIVANDRIPDRLLEDRVVVEHAGLCRYPARRTSSSLWLHLLCLVVLAREATCTVFPSVDGTAGILRMSLGLNVNFSPAAQPIFCILKFIYASFSSYFLYFISSFLNTFLPSISSFLAPPPPPLAFSSLSHTIFLRLPFLFLIRLYHFSYTSSFFFKGVMTDSCS